MTTGLNSLSSYVLSKHQRKNSCIKVIILSRSAWDVYKLTSRLWRAAAAQLEVEVISAEALALQVFK